MSSTPRTSHIEALDFIRALALIHIILYHYYVEWFRGSFLVTPGQIGQNIQLFQDGGVLGFIKTAFSFLFFYGFTSVNFFLLLSGFVLALSFLSRKQEKFQWFPFIGKRVKRLLIPFYISIVLGIGILYLRNLLFPALAAPPIYGWIDAVKLIFFPLFLFDYSLLQLFNGDYWYISLILQLSLLFPFLWWLLKKIGPKYFLGLTFGVTVLYRLLAVYGASFGFAWFDSVPMGIVFPSEHGYYGFAFFLPRLFEFALGMVLAHYSLSSEKFFERFTTKSWFLFSVFFTLFGFFLLYFRWGWIVSDGLIALTLSMFFLNLGIRLARLHFFRKFLQKISDSAYETYLLHHYLLNHLIIPFLLIFGVYREIIFWLFLPVYFFSIVVSGFWSFRLTRWVMK